MIENSTMGEQIANIFKVVNWKLLQILRVNAHFLNENFRLPAMSRG
jgi:hypothetical protein